jgi:hypothetical protein
MAKEHQNQQVAVCTEVNTVKTAKGKKEVYTFVLENQSFQVWEGKYFKAEEGQEFTPVVSIIPLASINKEGRAVARMTPVVNWELVGG